MMKGGYVQTRWFLMEKVLGMMSVSLLAGCYASERPRTIINSPGDTSSTYSANDDVQGQTQTDDPGLQLPTIEITQPEDKKVFKNKEISLTLQLVHSTQQWVAVSYDVGSGMIKTNHSSGKAKGEVLVKTNLQRDKNIINLTIRNLSKCKKLGMSDQQCLGKHSLRPLDKDLEFPYMTIIMAKDEPDGEGDGKSEIYQCREDPLCLKILEAKRDENCQKIHTDNFDFTIPPQERTARTLEIGLEYMNDFQSNGGDIFGGLIAAVAGMETATKKEDNETKAEKEKLRKEYEKCLKKYSDIASGSEQ